VAKLNYLISGHAAQQFNRISDYPPEKLRGKFRCGLFNVLGLHGVDCRDDSREPVQNDHRPAVPVANQKHVIDVRSRCRVSPEPTKTAKG
jgi:hypothetical protein